jgi:tetratricopeptide (TPR) repeat protein
LPAAARQNAYYRATLVETLIELGQVDRAGVEFQSLTPSASYQYYRVAGLHAQEVEGDLTKAIGFYRQATTIWPGPSDWLLMNRLSRCLAISGAEADSQTVASEASRVETLTDLTVHKQVRSALGNLNDPVALSGVANFYREFGREWEASEWNSLIETLQKSAGGENVP